MRPRYLSVFILTQALLLQVSRCQSEIDKIKFTPVTVGTEKEKAKNDVEMLINNTNVPSDSKIESDRSNVEPTKGSVLIPNDNSMKKPRRQKSSAEEEFDAEISINENGTNYHENIRINNENEPRNNITNPSNNNNMSSDSKDNQSQVELNEGSSPYDLRIKKPRLQKNSAEADFHVEMTSDSEYGLNYHENEPNGYEKFPSENENVPSNNENVLRNIKNVTSNNTNVTGNNKNISSNIDVFRVNGDDRSQEEVDEGSILSPNDLSDAMKVLNKSEEPDVKSILRSQEPIKPNKKHRKTSKELQVKFERSEANHITGAVFFTGLLVWLSAVAFILD